jgi:hypothetical protein
MLGCLLQNLFVMMRQMADTCQKGGRGLMFFSLDFIQR